MDEFTTTEKHSAVFFKFMKYAESRIQECRLQLERPLSHDETNVLRGKIAELKTLIKLGEDEIPAEQFE